MAMKYTRSIAGILAYCRKIFGFSTEILIHRVIYSSGYPRFDPMSVFILLGREFRIMDSINPCEIWKTDRSLMQHLVEKCGCKKIIAAGSCWDTTNLLVPVNENDPVSHGGNHFVWAKRSICDFGLMLASRYQISFLWTRLFYIYGPGQRSDSLIPTITEALLKGDRPDIRTPSNANDFVYVDDVADAMIHLVYREVPSGIYNLGTGNFSTRLESV